MKGFMSEFKRKLLLDKAAKATEKKSIASQLLSEPGGVEDIIARMRAQAPNASPATQRKWRKRLEAKV